MSTENEPPIGAQGTLTDVNVATTGVSFFDVILSAEDSNGNTAGVQRADGTNALKVAVEQSQANPLSASDQPFDVSAAEVDVDVASATVAGVSVDLNDVALVEDETDLAGEANAANVDLGDLRQKFDVHYNVATTDDDIHIEVSNDNTNWRTHTILSATDGEVNTGGQIIQTDTAYRYVQVYAGANFADADVQSVEITSKGV